MTATAPTLTIANLEKAYGDRTALAGIDLDVEQPEIIGIAGPNGSGKTTLIHCLLGLIEPTGGSIAIDGTTPPALGPADRARIGYMPQDRAIYDDLTVRANVAFFARLYGVTDRETAVRTALGAVDLVDRAGDRIDALSGGMVRRTSLACALVHDPDLLALDEPTVGLDPRLRAGMWKQLRDRRDEGSVVLVSTHYLDEVSRCDRVLFLRSGAVLAFDSPAAIRDRTGTDDMERAFLALLDGADTAPEVAP